MKDVNVLKNNGVNLEASLEYLGDMEMYDETLSEFLNGVDEKVSALTNFKDSMDMANYAISVHSLKSDARYLGFTTVADIAYAHEMESKNNNTEYVNLHFEELLQSVDKMIETSKLYLGNIVQQTITNESENNESSDSILIVDDSDMVRNFISKVFNNTFNCIMASDGSAAIEYLTNENNIRGILLDLNMPNVDGFEVLNYLQNNNLFMKYPVSIITGADDKDTITKAFNYPIIDMLQKPFNESDVKRIVERTISYGK